MIAGRASGHRTNGARRSGNKPTMTNGTVTGTVEAASGQELNLKFKDSSNKIVVLPGVLSAPSSGSETPA